MPVIPPPSKNTICIPIKKPPSWFRDGAPPLYSWRTFRIGGNSIRLSGPGGEEGICPKSKPVLVGPWISGAGTWKVLSEGGTWRTVLHVSSVFPFFFPKPPGQFFAVFFLCCTASLMTPLHRQMRGRGEGLIPKQASFSWQVFFLKIVRSHFMVGLLALLNSSIQF